MEDVNVQTIKFENRVLFDVNDEKKRGSKEMFV